MARRITLSVIALVTVLLGVVVVPLGLHTASQDTSDFTSQTVTTAVTIASVAEEHLDDHEPAASLRQAVAELERHGDQVAVYGKDGRWVAGSRSITGAGDAQIDRALAGRSYTGQPAEDRLVVASPVLKDETQVSIGAVVLARSTEPLEHRIATLWGWVALMSLAGLAAAIVTATALARWVSRPLGGLEAAARRLGLGEFDARAPASAGPPEVRRLTGNFNMMAGRLETLLSGHQAMIADVSHQLRTPLAALRLRLDVLALAAPDQVAEELAGAQEEVARLSRMVDGLLAVARAENVTSPAVAVPVDVVIAERAAAWRPAADEKPMTLETASSGPLWARLSEGHLEQVLDNLLANAIEAVPAGGLVRVASARASRLSAGWGDSDRPASLRDHLARFPDGVRSGAAPSGQLIEAVTQAGLTGRGGAGFPTGVKMRAVADRRGPAVVVVNGLESEPASDKDKTLMGRAPHLVLDGAVLAAAAVGADEVDVCLPRHAGWLQATMHNAVIERVRAGLAPVPVRLHDLPPGYVSSSETAVVNWLNGELARPVATPPRPFEKGVARRPTLVANAETLAHVALIARYGSAWFRRIGQRDAPGSMLTTITGGVAAPGVYEIEVGTPVRVALDLARPDEAVRHVLIGGYFGTWHDLECVGDVPLAGPALREFGACPGAGVLVALPAGACGLTETARVLWWLAGQGAEQCGPCLFGLPAIADDFAQLAAGQPKGSLLDRLDRRLGAVTGRGACAHPDGAVRLARSALSVFAADASAHTCARRCLHAHRGLPAPAHVLSIPAPPGTERWR